MTKKFFLNSFLKSKEKLHIFCFSIEIHNMSNFDI